VREKAFMATYLLIVKPKIKCYKTKVFGQLFSIKNFLQIAMRSLEMDEETKLRLTSTVHGAG
jgi:hypothetical protein